MSGDRGAARADDDAVSGSARMSDVTVVILAGGRGTRIQSIYPDTPKPMIPIMGRPFLYWLTAFLAKHGLTRFVYSTGYRAEQIEAWTRDGSFPDLARLTRHEQTSLGTGGGVLNCLDLCGFWTLVVNGDGLCLGGVADLLSVCRESDKDGGLLGVYVEDAARYGSLDIDADGLLQAFREKAPGSAYVNGGIYLFRTEALAGVAQPGQQSLERDLIPAMLKRGARLRIFRLFDVPFIDIGLPETLQQAEAFVRENLSALAAHP